MKRLLGALAVAALAASCSTRLPQAVAVPPAPATAALPSDSAFFAPESASPFTAKPGWATKRFIVAAANPIAAEAGQRMLRAGGSAIDAAVAVQMVLALVEPQSSGIGGGALLMHYDGKDVVAFDGRETAPAEVNERLFLDAQGKPLPFAQAVASGRSVGVPGAVRMLEMAHRRYGKLPWQKLFEPAIELAERGFAISPRLNALLASERLLLRDPFAAAYFYDGNGTAKAVGTTLRNPEFAEVLRRIAAQGSKALHEGAIARAIVDKVRANTVHAGQLSMGDLAGYRPLAREPICFDHTVKPRTYRICGFPPPSSGVIAMGQILGLLDRLNADKLPPERGLPGANWLHLYLEASRLAFADRAQFIADPAFVAAPANDWQSLLAPAYLTQRAALVGEQSLRNAAPPGRPGGTELSAAPMPEQPEFGTTHMNIIDGEGHAVAMTTTVESQFGSRMMVNLTGRDGGFLLNNQLTDFSFLPADAQGRPIANRVQPGKRPRSAMSPTFVFDKASGQLLMSAGSAGGAFIIHFTTKTLYAMLHWDLDAQRAIDLPNFGYQFGPSFLEAGRFPATTIEALRQRGAPVQEIVLTSGTQAVQRTPRGFYGGADPRREGTVLGE